jgi:hypothetical protein
MASLMSVGFDNNGASAPKKDTKWYSDDEAVALRVGGKLFQTQVGTLRKYGDSKLARMFPEDEPTSVPENKEFFIDR